jgi:hypothetical protein
MHPYVRPPQCCPHKLFAQLVASCDVSGTHIVLEVAPKYQQTLQEEEGSRTEARGSFCVWGDGINGEKKHLNNYCTGPKELDRAD